MCQGPQALGQGRYCRVYVFAWLQGSRGPLAPQAAGEWRIGLRCRRIARSRPRLSMGISGQQQKRQAKRFHGALGAQPVRISPGLREKWVKPDLTESIPVDGRTPVSFGDTGVSGGTGIPYSRGQNHFTTHTRKTGAKTDAGLVSLFKNFFMAEPVGRPSKNLVKPPAHAWLFGGFVDKCGGRKGGEDCVRKWRPF